MKFRNRLEGYNNMKVKNYQPEYSDEVFRLWNTSGVRQGFVKLNQEDFQHFLIGHSYFSKEYAFVLADEEYVHGFICGCVNEDTSEEIGKGYFICLLLSEDAENENCGKMLLSALEDSFIRAGRGYIECSFFSPIHLPWVIPGTEGHQHNNAPGIAAIMPCYEWMKNCGYEEMVSESAMYLDLKSFVLPGWVEAKKSKALERGYTIEWYDKKQHEGLISMVESTGNPVWSTEIPEAAEKINMIVAVKNNEVVGFTGPVYPEESGRGYFAGIAVSAKHEKQGLGTLLFYTLCQMEKEVGAEYMSLFTESDSHARIMYQGAGFCVKRVFSIMRKKLNSL